MIPGFVIGAAACLLLAAGCRETTTSLDERDERNPLMEQAKQRERANDIEGAMVLYQEALDDNPALAKAHLQIGLLADQHQEDFVRAIYHYRRYLELRPDAEKRVFIEELIRQAELSYAASLPDKPSSAIREVARLKEEVKSLETSLESSRQTIRELRASIGGMRQASAPGSSAAASTPPGAAASVPTASQTTYTVQSGDNLSRIAARVYNDRNQWRRIFEANRDSLRRPEDLRVGQVLVIPKE